LKAQQQGKSGKRRRKKPQGTKQTIQTSINKIENKIK